MSWLFSQALVEEFSAANCSDGEPSVQLSVMPTQHKFWRNDKTMEFSRLSQFGLTCAVLTENRGQELLMSYLEASRARTSPLQAKAVDWTARGLGYGEKWLGLLAKYDPDSRSLKTAQCSLLEDLIPSSVTLPHSGLMLDGECFQIPQLAHLTGESESGYWATPCATDGAIGGYMTESMTGQSLAQMVNSPRYWPTPMHSEARQGLQIRREGKKGTQESLTTAVMTWPTPTARIWKGGGDAMTRKDGKSRSDMLDWAVEYQTGGRLNPQWVEWLMGWPVGWTDLKPLETDKSQSVQLKPSSNCMEVSK